jgi:hypothetical protein
MKAALSLNVRDDRFLLSVLTLLFTASRRVADHIKSLQVRFRREKRQALFLSHSREQMLQDGRWPKGM